MRSVRAVSFGLSSPRTVAVSTMEGGAMISTSRSSTACLPPGLVLRQFEVVQVRDAPL